MNRRSAYAAAIDEALSPVASDGRPATNHYARSQALHGRACTVIPGGVNSNVRLDTVPVPLFFERAEGCRLTDVDGNRYIDYVLGNGPAILGHAPPAVVAAVRDSLALGQAIAAQHPAEIELAELIRSAVPCAERLRLCSTGSEAVASALRLARAFTGRQRFVKFEGHYHGWHDGVAYSYRPALNEAGPRERPDAVAIGPGQAASTRGDVVVLPWNDRDLLTRTLEAEGADIAAVIMEPIMCNNGVVEPRPGYLEGVAAACRAHGVMLIFDEVITGFRVALGGAQAVTGVVPDLACFAKAVAGGFPLACVAGRADILDRIGAGGVAHGGTYNSNLPSVFAAIATLRALARDDGAAYHEMREQGRRLMAGLVAAAESHGQRLLAQGPGPVFSVAFTDRDEITDYRGVAASDRALLAAWVAALQHRGLRVGGRGVWFLSTAHDAAAIDETLARADAAFADLAAG